MLLNEVELSKRRDSVILSHVELYRLTITPAVERIFYGTGQSSNDAARLQAVEALEELVTQKKLVARSFPNANGAGGGETYYVLPAPRQKKLPADSQAIDFDLQTLWLATLSEQRFHRLTVTDIRRLFPAPPHHHVRHVIGDCGDGPCVYRIYPSKVGVKESVSRLKQFISEARTKYGLGSWLDCGDYGFTILVDNHRKAQAISEAVISKRQGAGALADQVRIQVAFAPTASNVTQAIAEL